MKKNDISIEGNVKSNGDVNLGNTIENQNNIVINIKYSDYNKNKELFNEYISLGYNLSLELDDSFEYTENNLIWLSIFKYVLGNSELIPQDKLIER